MNLDGKAAIITGAGTSVGRELALELARQGARVACAGRRTQQLQETVRLIESEGGRGIAVPTDIIDRAQVDRLVRATLDAFVRIDILVNNAGSFRCVAPLWEASPAEWWHDVTTNLCGSMLCCRAVLPHMMAANSGVIINIDGGGSSGPNLGGSGYACSKAALLRLNDNLAAELKTVGSAVLVFGMNPGLVRSEMTDYVVATPERAKWQGHVPKLFAEKRDHPPDACAKAVVKLLAIACPELSGRAFGVTTDFDEVARRKQEIAEKDLLMLRFRGLDAGK